MPGPRKLVLAVAALLALAGCGGDERRAAPEPDVLLVVQDDAELLHRTPERIAATLDDLRSLGVDWVRITAQWNAIVPDAGAPANWAPLDQAVDMVTDRGMRVAVDIAFGPPGWATLERDFGDFAETVAARYPQAAAFTIWNEPNHPVFLGPQWRRAGDGFVPAAPHAYRAMLREAVPRVRAAAPGALVLIGATSSLGVDAGTDVDDRISPLRFVRELACVDAQLRPLETPECAGEFAPLPGDGFSHHPYSGELPPWESDADDAGNVRLADLDRLRGLLDRLHAAGRIEQDLPLYLTEYGYQTNPPDPTWDVTPAEQARWLAEAEEIARAEPSVRSVAHFLHRDLPKRSGDANPWGDFQTGLVFEDGTPKPAHDALALPLVAHRLPDGRVRFWGLVRPGEGPHEARVEIQEGAAWRTLFDVTTDAEGVFERAVATDPTATFRLVGADRTGAPLAGAR